jgi:hypothetical protein
VLFHFKLTDGNTLEDALERLGRRSPECMRHGHIAAAKGWPACKRMGVVLFCHARKLAWCPESG